MQHPSAGAKSFILWILIGVLLGIGSAELTMPSFPRPHQNSPVARGGNLVAAISSDPSSFNRMVARPSLANATVADRLASDLVHINRASFELEPALADRWEMDKDGRTYTIHLRRGVRFSDGAPFTADDVVFSMRVLQSPDSMLADQVRIDGNFPTCTKLDDSRVRLTFPRPVGMGLRCLDSIPMLPRHKLSKMFEEGKIASAWGPGAPPQDLVVLGPFRLKEYRRGERVVMERNPYYWKKDSSGRSLPYLDSITFLIIPDRNSEALRFQAGELDVINELNPENYASLRQYQKERNYTLRDLGPGLMMDYLWFNLNPGKEASGRPFVDAQKRALFEQKQFRQAVSCALDREGMALSILLGLGTPQFGPISSGNKIWYDSKIARVSLNIGRARELLAQMGLRDKNRDGVLEFGANDRPLEIDLLTARGNVVREKIAEVVKENLAGIGIRVNVQPIPSNELIERLLNSFNYEAILFGFQPMDVAPDLQTDFWYSSGKSHFWHPGQSKPQRPWESEIDTQISRLLSNLDPVARKRAFDRVQEIWADEMPAIATLTTNIIAGHSNAVGNLRPSILSPHLLWNSEELTKTPNRPGANP